MLEPGGVYQVPTGSGETILAMRWAWPECSFWPLYGTGPHTRRDAENPVNFAVEGPSE